MRVPIVAGQFYESDFTQLDNQIKKAFEQGPGSTPLTSRNNDILGAIIPHSPYKYSAKCAAWAFKDIAETPMPFTYIILGTLHKKLADRALLSLKDFSTPFGLIKTDRNLVNNLLKEHNFKLDENSHALEHSIEVQLPFLQYISQNNLETLRILPILISTQNLNILKKIALTLSKLNNVIYLASSDLLHYGPLYKFSFKYNSAQETENLTNKILDKLLRLNSQDFLNIIERSSVHICGASPIILLLEILKLKNIEKGKLLDHYNYGDKENFIDFASIVYHKE